MKSGARDHALRLHLRLKPSNHASAAAVVVFLVRDIPHSPFIESLQTYMTPL